MEETSVANELESNDRRRRQGLRFYGGSNFPIDFWMGLTTEKLYCAACGVIFNSDKSFLANLNSRSRSLYAIARPSVVCNVRAPYSDGRNFCQFFFAVWYLSHPLTSTENGKFYGDRPRGTTPTGGLNAKRTIYRVFDNSKAISRKRCKQVS